MSVYVFLAKILIIQCENLGVKKLRENCAYFDIGHDVFKTNKDMELKFLT